MFYFLVCFEVVFHPVVTHYFAKAFGLDLFVLVKYEITFQQYEALVIALVLRFTIQIGAFELYQTIVSILLINHKRMVRCVNIKTLYKDMMHVPGA